MRISWMALACASAAAGADFEYADFRSAKDLNVIQDASRSKSGLELTPAMQFQAGAAWHRAKQPVDAGFDTTFTFRLTNQGGLGMGADGLAFVVQNESAQAIGGYGASAGFMRSDEGAPPPFRYPIARMVAVFFDTYENQWDANDNYVAVCIQKTKTEMRWPPRCLSYSRRLKVKLKDGKPHTARVWYRPPRLSVYVDDLEEPVETASLDVATIVGGDGSAWVGFTAATGGSWENHDVLSWKFTTPAKSGAESNVTVVSSEVSFSHGACVPGKKLCTPDAVVVQETGPGRYHVILPANREWGASVPNAGMGPARAFNVKGLVCWDPRLPESAGCNGPAGNGTIPGKEAEGAAGFVATTVAAGALVGQNLNGRAYFTVNDRTGAAFEDNEGYFEFDVEVAAKK